MPDTKPPEWWMRGAVDGVPALLQPVAHTLLQAREEITETMKDFPEFLLWEKPGGLASPAFHLQHITGFLDRLFSYARGVALNPEQLKWLAAEGKKDDGQGLASMLDKLNSQVDISLKQLVETEPGQALAFRGVGRKQLPSNVLGLLFHAAEHMMRHAGQLRVTVSWLKGLHFGK